MAVLLVRCSVGGILRDHSNLDRSSPLRTPKAVSATRNSVLGSGGDSVHKRQRLSSAFKERQQVMILSDMMTLVQ